jgi:Ethanolamine utilization protein EutJ (predicted chaperonin)
MVKVCGYELLSDPQLPWGVDLRDCGSTIEISVQPQKARPVNIAVGFGYVYHEGIRCDSFEIVELVQDIFNN